ncbi:MAG: hypothetical protein WB902_33450, partial [Acetobacteraceae bacterium]
TWKMTATDPIEVQATLDRERNRLFFMAQNAAAEAERERDKVIAQRAKVAVDKLSVTGDARSQLIATHAHIAQAERLAQQAHTRAAGVALAAQRRDHAATELEALDVAVRSAFESWVAYDSADDRPDDRSDERARLVSDIQQHEIEAALVPVATQESAVADAVTEELTSRLPRLRHHVVMESAAPLAEVIASLTEQLGDAYARMAALGTVTRLVQNKFSLRLPALPYSGTYQLEVTPDQTQVEAYRRDIAALESDPTAPIGGVEPKRNLLHKILGV